LSHAEFELIEAYLDKGALFLGSGVNHEVNGSFTAVREPAESLSTPLRSAKVIWLKDQQRAKTSAKLSRYSSSHIFKR